MEVENIIGGFFLVLIFLLFLGGGDTKAKKNVTESSEVQTVSNGSAVPGVYKVTDKGSCSSIDTDSDSCMETDSMNAVNSVPTRNSFLS